MNDLLFSPISEIAPRIRAKEISPVELTRAALQQIEATDGRLNAFPVVKSEEALSAAADAEHEIQAGRWKGPLHGIPVGLKDNIAVNGWVTTCGSRILAEHVTDYDATAVRRLREAGAVILGKNNLHEWALGGSCTFGIFGTVHNPWNTEHIAGGSSGGSAAAVSAGQAFMALGTDARASIRTPASYCGVVGLKPTGGLVSRFGELPPTSSWYMALGPIARTVTDVAITLNAISGYDDLDPGSIRTESRDYTAGIDDGVKGLRIGVVKNFFYDDALPEVRDSVEAAASAYRAMGASVREVELPALRYTSLIEPVYEGEAKGWLVDYALTRGADFDSQDIRYRALASRFLRTADTLRANRLLNLLRAQVQEVMEEIDILLTPTNSTPPYRIDAEEVEVADGTVNVAGAGGQSRVTTRLTVPFNALALPAISVPCGMSNSGLPFGLQLVGRSFEDHLVLRAARAFEREAGLGYRRPPIVA